MVNDGHDDDTAEMRKKMLENALKANPDMDIDTRAKFMADLLSTEGQIKGARERLAAEKRQNGGKERE